MKSFVVALFLGIVSADVNTTKRALYPAIHGSSNKLVRSHERKIK